MKTYRIEPQILLLQSVRDSGKFVGQQRAQVAFFAADQNSNFIGMDGGADFHAAKGRRIQPDSHFGVRGSIHDLCHLHWAGNRSNGEIASCGQI